MPDNPQDVAATAEAPPPPPPHMTEQAFLQEFDALIQRGIDSRLNWLVIVIRGLFRRGVSMLDMALASVEKEIGSGIGKKK